VNTIDTSLEDHINEFNETLKTIPTSFGDEELYDEVKELLFGAVKKSIGGEKKVGILFSGGVDSVVVAKIANSFVPVVCYNAGLEGCQDTDYAKRAAEALGLELKVRVIGQEEVESYIRKVIDAIKEANIMKVGVGIPIFAACELSEEKRLLAGFGGEELFVGYKKFKQFTDWQDLQNRLWNGLYQLGWKDKYRDCLIANSLGKEIRSPLLDFDVIRTVMRVHPKYKIDEKQDKLLLRKIGKEIGLPDFVYNRPKKATQYGSGIDKAIRKLAKNEKMQVQDYLQRFLSNK
jgi:asparagine synthase (glutamine-hydrolysing)